MRLDINGKECHSLCCVFFYHRNLSTPNNLHRDGGRVLRAEGGVLAHHFRCHVVLQSRLFALKSQKANSYFNFKQWRYEASSREVWDQTIIFGKVLTDLKSFSLFLPQIYAHKKYQTNVLVRVGNRTLPST